MDVHICPQVVEADWFLEELQREHLRQAARLIAEGLVAAVKARRTRATGI